MVTSSKEKNHVSGNQVIKNCVSWGLPSSKPSSPATSSSVTSIRDSTAIVAGIGSSSEKLDFFKDCLHRVDITECLSPISNMDAAHVCSKGKNYELKDTFELCIFHVFIQKKSHREIFLFAFFLKSTHQVAMKNVVKC